MKEQSAHFSFSWKYLFVFLLTLVLYIIAGKFGLKLAFVNASATAIWPPTGIAIALLLLLGYRVWPAIFLGAFIVNITTQGGIPTSLGIALGNTLEGIVAVYLINHFANGQRPFDTIGGVFTFSIIGVLSTMVSATIGVSTLVLTGYEMIQRFSAVWVTWWLGDLGGALVMAPIIIIFWTKLHHQWRTKRVIQTIILYVLLAVGTEVIFGGSFPSYPYMELPFLVWIAFMLGQRETAGGVLILSTIIIWDTLQGKGAFFSQAATVNDALLQLQLFLIIIATSIFALSAAVFERKKAQTVITTTEKRFHALIEKSYDAVVLIDPTSKISYASPSITRILGYLPEEIEGTVGFDLVDPMDRKKTMETLAKLVLKPGGTVTVQYRTIRKDGTRIWIEATGTNLLFDPSIHAVVINFRDITQMKKDNEELEHEKAEDDALLASIGEGMFATDEKGIIVLVNDAACRILGWKRSQLVGKSLVKAIPMQDGEGRTLPESERAMVKVLSERRKIVTSPHNYYIRSDKTKIPVRFTVTPVILGNKLVGTIEVFRDITQETEIDRAKSEFVSLASHQLRTPLTTINWYIERLTEEKIPTKEKKYLHEIYQASARMVNLVNALLNVSRLELGTFITKPKEIVYGDLIKQSINDASGLFLQQKHKIILHVPKNLPLINADPKLLSIVVQNLITNAIKYSKVNGEIIVSLRYDSSGFVLKVADSGYGIAKKDQNKIFTKMFRADNARVLDQNGSGLGLYMVKFIVDEAGGKIWFESEENKGTTFFVRFPKTGMKQKEGTKQLR